MDKKKPHVLICPLNWGIGHAARCIPLIRTFLSEGAKVTLAGEGYPMALLREAFPELDHVIFPGFRVVYPSGKNMIGRMIRSAPGIIAGIWSEHRELERLIHALQVDIVVSDNRFGLWNNKVHSVYITHQVSVKAPVRLKWTEKYLYRIHRMIINKYDECWVPDMPGANNLSGELSHGVPIPSNTAYIGPLSRFAAPGPEISAGNTYDLAVMLSGPEPQRTLLENKILGQLASSGRKAFVFRGRPGDEDPPGLPGHITLSSHGDDNQIRQVLRSSKLVICRSGYSTIMDLVALGTKALLVPTPGQTEQEYLARYMRSNGWFDFVEQDRLNINGIDPDDYPFAPPPEFFDVSLPGSIIRKTFETHGP